MTTGTDKLTRSSAVERRPLESDVAGSNPAGSVLPKIVKTILSPFYWAVVGIGTPLACLIYKLAKVGDNAVYAKFSDGIGFCFWCGIATLCITIGVALMSI